MIPRAGRAYLTGPTGLGKSHLARALWSAFAPPRLVIDPKNDPAATGRLMPDGRTPVTFSDPRRLPAADVIRFVPRDPFDIDAYDALGAEVWQRPGLVTWLDEVGDVIPSTARASREWLRIVRQGRVRTLGVIATHQRPVEVHRSMLGNAGAVIMFAQGFPADLDILAAGVGVPPATLRGWLSDLDSHGFAVYTPQSRRLLIVTGGLREP